MRNEVIEKRYTLRTLDFDNDINVKPSAVLDLFQDSAGYHTKLFECDREHMIERGLFWVLVNVKYEILKMPEPTSDVIVKTWPLRSAGVRYIRNFKINDVEGNLLIKGISCWAVLDATTRRIVPKLNVYPEDMVYCDELTFGEKLDKIKDFEPTAALKTVKTEFCDLDFNSHVNNAKYADFIVNALFESSTVNIKTFQIDYHKEIRLGEEIMIFSKEENGAIFVKGVSKEGETRFISAINL